MGGEGATTPGWADEFLEAMKDIGAIGNAALDQAHAMTDAELGRVLLTGRWTTIEVHEAARRLVAGGSVGSEPETKEDTDG